MTPVLLSLYLVIILIAGWIAPDYYSVIRNTLSELAAQKFPHAWLMRSGFFIFGCSIFSLGFLKAKIRKLNLWQTSALLFLLLYGGTIFTTGFWSEKNFFILDHNLESFIHNFFVRFSNMFFLLSVWSNAAVEKNRTFTLASVVVFIAFASISVFFVQFEEFQGITQRSMHFIAVIWLFLLYRRMNQVPEPAAFSS